MNPVLKKKLIERGLKNTGPRHWQETGWQAEKCPNYNRALHGKDSQYVCDYCGKVFERKDWKLRELTFN